MMSEEARCRFRIVEDDLSGNEIQELLRLHAEGMLSNSPKDACHFLDLSGLQDPLVTVWSAWDGEQLAGCGAVKEIDTTHGEVKSMRTATEHLGRGVGRAILEHIVASARQRSYKRLSLETGTGDSFDAAVHLYESVGFERCDPFASYEDNDFSQFFTLSLTHYVPPMPLSGTEDDWRALAAEHFDGTIEVGDDLHRVDVTPR